MKIAALPAGWRRALVTALLVTGALAAFALPMFSVPDGIASGDPYRDNDWLNCRAFDLMARQAMLEHGQFPLRSHLVGGGYPTLAHPSDGSWAPTMLAVLALGDVLGVKVNILLLLLLGCWGVFGLARQVVGLSWRGGVLAALLFGFSGWLPSMLLVGFYQQLFYLAAPAVVLLLLTSEGRLHRLLLAGLLLALVLQQGGNAFPCVVLFAAITAWLVAADDSPGDAPRWQRMSAALLLLALVLPPLALAREQSSPVPVLVGWGVAAVAVWRVPLLRRLAVTLAPWALRLALALVVACSLGAARLAGLQYLQQHGVSYQHTDVCKDQQRHQHHECFYRGPLDLARGLIQRAPDRTDYRSIGGRRVEPLTPEYAWLGLTIPPLLLALAGLALWRRRVAVLAALGLIFTGICLGWELPLDLHRLLTTGLPGLHHVGQPIKYYNFFILLPLVLLAAAGVEGIAARARHPWARRAVWIVAGALLALPFAQNRGALGQLFRQPLPRVAEQPYQQLMQVGSRQWLTLPPPELRRRVQAGGVGPLRLRESGRPLVATEYHNARRGVGVIDWYGTLLLPERSTPARYLLPDGRQLANPRYRGEAWTRSGAGQVHSVHIKPNTIELDVTLTAADVVVVNQSYLRGFVSDQGAVQRVVAPGQPADDKHGLLGVRLERAGRHRVQLTFRPAALLSGLALSGASLLAWLVAFCWLYLRRGRGADVRDSRCGLPCEQDETN